MTQRPTLVQCSDRVRCHIHGVRRELVNEKSQILRLMEQSGYSTEVTSNMLDSGVSSFIEEPKTFATEAEFLREHERLSLLAKKLVPSATVETLYYAEGEGTPKYSRTS